MSGFNTYIQRHAFFVTLVGICLALLFGSAGQGTAAALGPRIVLPETRYDIGEVFEDQPLVHTYEVQNAGDAPLEIRHIEPDCACTLADYDRVIPPGHRGQITLTIEPYSVIHQFCKKTDIFTNDPVQPVVTIQFCGVAKPFIEIQPRHIIRFRGHPEDALTARVRLISNLLTPLHLTGYSTNIADKIEVTIEPEKPGKIYIVRVNNKCRQIGRYKGNIEITTNSAKRPRLILRVFADLYPASATNP